MKIGTEVSISAAHIVQTTESKCSNIHGHNWDIYISIDSNVQDDGMVVDFNNIKNLINVLDHKLILPEEIIEVDMTNRNNYVVEVHDKMYSIPKSDCYLVSIPVVTAEYLANLIWNMINAEFSIVDFTVRVYESKKSWAEYGGAI